MSILGSGFTSAVFQLDGQGAIVSSSDLFVNGWLRASGLTELYGGLSTTSTTTSSCIVSTTLSVGGDAKFTKISGTSVNLSGDVFAGGEVVLNPNGIDTGVGRGVRFWDASSTDFAAYMAQSGAGKSTVGGAAIATGGGLAGTSSAFSGYAIRNRMSANPTRGWLWENGAEECAMSVRSDGHAYVRQSLTVGGGGIDCLGPLKINGDAPVTSGDLNAYLSKSEFDTYNFNESLKELAQTLFNTAIEGALEGVQTSVAVIGSSFIAGTFTLGGLVIENVDDALHSLDGRLISVEEVVALKPDANTVYSKLETDAALNLKANQSSTYTKTETNTALNLKANQSTTFTKTETKAELDLKANQLTTYTKTETNTALNLKANQLTTYTKLETDSALNLKSDQLTTYTQLETDSALNLKSDRLTTYTKLETDSALNLKADQLTTYTKLETDSTLDLKANQLTTYTIIEVDTALADRYTKLESYNRVEADTLLLAKLNIVDYDTNNTTLNTLLAEKADSLNPTFTGNVAIPSYANLTTTLNTYATNISEILADKADLLSPTFKGTVNLPSLTSTVINNVTLDSLFVAKADKNYVDFADSVLSSSKASVAYVDSVVNGFASKSYIDNAIAQKYNNGYANSVNLIGVTLGDSFIIDTDNVSGDIEVHCTPAYNVEEITSELTKTTPWFSNATTPNANGVWPTTPWTISSRLNTNNAYNAINGTNVWTSSAAQSETTANVNEWWQIRFPAAVKIASYSWTNGGGRSLGFPGTWTLQYSNDGISFTIAGSYTAGTFQETGEKSTYAVDNYHPAATHWRLVVTQIRSSGWVCTLSGLVFNTVGIFGAPTFLSARSTDLNTFKIIIVDLSGASVSMLNTTASWKFNIMVTKGGKVVCSGTYQISRNATTGLGILTKITPTSGTIATTSEVENPSALPDVSYPTPCGTILFNAGYVIPIGYLKCDGTAISRTTYANLYAIIGILYGVGDGTTTFNVPNLVDQFLRMTGPIAGEISTKKTDSIKSHTHLASINQAGSHLHPTTISSGGSHNHSGSTNNGGAHVVDTQIVNQLSVPFGNKSGFAWTNQATNNDAVLQVDNIPNHSHSLNIDSGGSHNHTATVGVAGNHTHTIDIASTGDVIETRPRSVAVNYVIKY